MVGGEHAPVALFAHRRPQHLARTLSALSANPEASFTDLVVFVDGPRTPSEASQVAAVVEICAGAVGFKSVEIHRQDVNRGLSRSIVEGVSLVLARYPSVIVLEDDLVVAPVFLAYMNEGLQRFADDESVVSVHGYVYPLRQEVPNAFFIRGADCWGWATWRRGWQAYRADGQVLLDEIHRRGLSETFDFDGSFPYEAMLRAQVAGKIDSWAIRWYASAFLANKLTLYPGKTLVDNIGSDGSGTHGDVSRRPASILATVAPNLDNVAVRENEVARAAFTDYFRQEQRIHRKAAWQLRQWRHALTKLPSRLASMDRR